MRTVWVSFDTIGRDCLEAAADVGRGRRRGRDAARSRRPEPIGPVLVRRGCGPDRRADRGDGGHQRRRDAGGRQSPRSGADLRRRLVAARARPVHRARAGGRLRHAPDVAAASSRTRTDPVGDPHGPGQDRGDALRDRRCHRGLRCDRRAGGRRHRAGRDGDDALRPACDGACRPDPRVRAADRRRGGSARAPGPAARELVAEARPERRDHRLGDARAATSTTGSARRRGRIPGRSRSSATRRSSCGAPVPWSTAERLRRARSWPSRRRGRLSRAERARSCSKRSRPAPGASRSERGSDDVARLRLAPVGETVFPPRAPSS